MAEAARDEIEEEERYENDVHLLSKLCAIGYLAMECKESNVTAAVVHGRRAVGSGDSNGHGKSLIRKTIAGVVGTAFNRKKANMFQ